MSENAKKNVIVEAEVEETEAKAEVKEATEAAQTAEVKQNEPKAEENVTTNEADAAPQTTIKDVGGAVANLGKTLWAWKPVRTMAKGAGIVLGAIAVGFAGREVLKALAEDKAANDYLASGGGTAGNIEAGSSETKEEPTYVEAEATDVTTE